MTYVVALLLSVPSLFGRVGANYDGPVVIHYGPGKMERVAQVHHLYGIQKVWVAGEVKYRVAGQLYDGLATTPLCDSHHLGNTIQADLYSRFTGEWGHVRLYQTDVSQEWDRDDQIDGGRLLEVNYELQAANGWTLQQGWGRGPVANVQSGCPR